MLIMAYTLSRTVQVFTETLSSLSIGNEKDMEMQHTVLYYK